MTSLALVWELIARDHASGAFLKTAAAAEKTATATGRAAVGTERVGVAAEKNSHRVAGFAKSMGALAAVDLGYHLAKSAASFQSAMLMIHTQAGATTSEVKKMTPAILALAGPVATAPEKLATSLYHVESIGLRGAKALDIVRLAAEGAKIGHADLEQTTNALTSTFASGIKGVSSMSQAMGVLTATVGAGDMRMQDLNDALGSGVLTVVKQYGVTMRDAGAALATFGDNNIRGAHAGTMLRMAVQALAVPARAGSKILGDLGITSEGSVKALSKLHLTTSTLSRDMQTGGLNKALLDLKGHLDKAGIAGDQIGTILTQAFGKKAGPGLQVLIGQLPRFESKLKAVAAGGNKFGSDWQAWLKSSAGRFGQLQGTVEGLGIKIGTALLPALQRGADALKNVFTFVSDHSGTFKTLAVGILGVAAAVKVVSVSLAIVSKIQAFASIVQVAALKMAAAFGSTGAAAQLSSMGIVTANSRASVAVTASAVLAKQSAAQFAVAESLKADAAAAAAAQVAAATAGTGSILEANAALASTDAATFAAAQQAKADAAVASAAEITAAFEETGAASSLALGPIGVAIGAVVGVAGFAAHALGLFGGSAKKAVQPEDDLTAAILRNNGALGTNVRAMIAQKLESAGAYDAALQLGISQKTLTDATLGNKNALQQVHEATKGYAAIQGQSILTDTKAGAALARKEQAYLKVKKAVGDLSGTLQASRQAAENEAKANSNAGKNDTARAVAMKAVIKMQDAVGASLNSLTGKLDVNIATGKSNVPVLHNTISSFGKLAEAQLNSGTSLKDVTGFLGENVTALRKQAVATGVSGTEVDKLTAKYKLTPKQIITNMVANIGKATASAGQLQKIIDAVHQNRVPGLSANSAQGRAVVATLNARINSLHQRSVPQINIDTSAAMAKLQSLLANIPKGTFRFNAVADITAHAAQYGPTKPGRAAGGGAPEGWFSVGEQGAELVRKFGSKVDVYSNRQSKAILAATGMRAPGFAAGTINAAMPTTRPAAPGSSDAAEMLRLLTAISRKLDHLGYLPQVGPDVADALSGGARRAAVMGRTSPAGRGF